MRKRLQRAVMYHRLYRGEYIIYGCTAKRWAGVELSLVPSLFDLFNVEKLSRRLDRAFVASTVQNITKREE